MRVQLTRVLLILVSLVIINPAFADQKIKTKSNIKNDRIQQPAAETDCAGEGCAAVVGCEGSKGQGSVTKDTVDADCKKSEQANSTSSSGSAE